MCCVRYRNTALGVTILNGSSSFHIIGELPYGTEGESCPDTCASTGLGGRCGRCGQHSMLCCRFNHPSRDDVCLKPLEHYRSRIERLRSHTPTLVGRPRGWICVHPSSRQHDGGLHSGATYPKVRVFNPSVSAEDGSLAVNVQAATRRDANMNSSAFRVGYRTRTSSVWLSPTGAVRHVRHNAEDTRLVNLLGERYSLFSRYRLRQAKDVWLGSMRPPFSELKLQYAKRANSEGNWLPFVHQDTLYVLYSICPHLVLRVNVSSGECSEAYHEAEPASCKGYDVLLDDPPAASGKAQITPSPGLRLGRHDRTQNFARTHRGSASQVLRGSAIATTAIATTASVARSEARHTTLKQGRDATDAMIGLAHKKKVGAGGVSYTHHFIRLSIVPPFKLLGISRAFRFPRFLSLAPGPWIRPRIDDIQFCLSLRVEFDGSLSMHYGAGDAAALSLHVPRAVYCNFTSWC